MAPMAGITNLPFRLIVKKMGAGLVTTEMVSAMGLIMGKQKTLNYLQNYPDEKPLSVQIFGFNPHAMATAAEMVVDAGADVVDINMGCPARKVVRTGAGGALLREPEKVKEIVTAVRKVCKVPLTVKIRAGWSPSRMNAPEIAKQAEAAGADAVTVHPRFVSQKFSGKADWCVIADVKKQVKIPVIGNGDIFAPHLAQQLRKETGCDGVMIGRGAIGMPWIFRQILALENGKDMETPTLKERKDLILEHFHHLSKLIGEKRASFNMRGLLLWYTKGLPYGRRFRGAFTCIRDCNALTNVLDEYFAALEDRGFES